LIRDNQNGNSVGEAQGRPLEDRSQQRPGSCARVSIAPPLGKRPDRPSSSRLRSTDRQLAKRRRGTRQNLGAPPARTPTEYMTNRSRQTLCGSVHERPLQRVWHAHGCNTRSVAVIAATEPPIKPSRQPANRTRPRFFQRMSTARRQASHSDKGNPYWAFNASLAANLSDWALIIHQKQLTRNRRPHACHWTRTCGRRPAFRTPLLRPSTKRFALRRRQPHAAPSPSCICLPIKARLCRMLVFAAIHRMSDIHVVTDNLLRRLRACRFWQQDPIAKRRCPLCRRPIPANVPECNAAADQPDRSCRSVYTRPICTLGHAIPAPRLGFAFIFRLVQPCGGCI
jgi:hypothetical protein